MSQKEKKINRSGGVPGASTASTRARATPVASEVKRDRVYRIAYIMATGEWSDDRATELAAEWGLTPTYLRFMAAEASRLLEFQTGDREKLIEACRVRLRQIADQDGPDRVQALRTLFENLGALRKRVEMSGPDGEPIPIDATAKIVVLPPEDGTG